MSDVILNGNIYLTIVPTQAVLSARAWFHIELFTSQIAPVDQLLL